MSKMKLNIRACATLVIKKIEIFWEKARILVKKKL